MDAKHCEKSPDCCHPWDDSCSCRCEGCDPKETCPDCGTIHSSWDEHESNNCVQVLRTRLTAANALLQEAVRLVDGYHRPYGWDDLSDRIARHLRNEEG